MNASSIFLGFLARTVLAVLLVAVILLFATPARDLVVGTFSSLARWSEVGAAVSTASARLEVMANEADARYAALKSRSEREITERLKGVERELEGLRTRPTVANATFLGMAKLLREKKLEEALYSDLRRAILKQESDALFRLKVFVNREAAAKAQREGIEEWATKFNIADARVSELESSRRKRKEEGGARCSIPFTACHEFLKELDANLDAARKQRESADGRLRDVLSRAVQPADGGPAPDFRVDGQAVRAAHGAMLAAVEQVRSWHVFAARPILDALEAAAWIVTLAVATALGFKLFFFYVMAPLAERRPPLVVQPGGRAPVIESASRAALSLPVDLGPGDQLLILGSYLQSAPDGARTRTKLFLSGTAAITSVLCGMWMLTGMRVTEHRKVVVSATTDALEEISAITLSEGEALVLQPKHLVAVRHPIGRSVTMRSRWKVGMHAWLTLQFRYLVFTGPCTLIVRGCRGVRVERTDEGRTVSQAMTVGFSPHLAYSVARTETFTAYLFGQRPLFNDRLRGPGIVLYQEVPTTAQRAGFVGRGMQGVMDGAMKAFGI